MPLSRPLALPADLGSGIDARPRCRLTWSDLGSEPVEIVELTEADLPSVIEVCRAALDLPEDAAEAEAIVARLWADGAGRRPAAGVVAVHEGDVVGVATGSMSPRDAAVGHIDLVAVLPQRRRGGVGRALLTRVEALLAELGAGELRICGNEPYYAWPGIDVRYTPAICAATALGYQQCGTGWNMTADLSEGSPALRDTAPDEQRLAAQGITVRRATVDDLPGLVAFATDTFGGAWPDEIVDSVGRGGAGCHLAVRDDGQILGFASYGSSRPSWFGPMGTAPATRGLGIGGLLLRRCLREQRAAGHRWAQIGWAGPVGFYADSVGARIERVFMLYQKTL